VIGGIIGESYNKSRNGIPLLSKIPLLGYLFGSTTDEVQRTELILMVTPHVVGSHEEADLLTEEYASRLKGIKEQIDQRMKKQAREKVDMNQSNIHFHDSTDGVSKE
jgi:general secretion pathway protein D